ncbi:unnamed protein product [Closterium sp. NIES-64]|nr:unnamed protein product [Closterium sp. NIES-64]CAI5956244.1 unnamed protein product [Closterium sp. NIES-65]CAI5966735.1 unnamed protein product [Closterium sp. NIES-65]
MAQQAPQSARDNVLRLSDASAVDKDAPRVRGYTFEEAGGAGSVVVDYEQLMGRMVTTGFQATALGRAIDEVNRMLAWRLSDDPVKADAKEEEKDPAFRAGVRCKIFLGFTSNLISSGLRETLCFLAKHRLVDVIVTTAGGIEEDIIKCLAPTLLGDFALPGKDLRAKGLNRIGNLIVPNSNYCLFEDWMGPVLDRCLDEQKTQGVVWTPSKLIERMGEAIGHEESVLYWAHKNRIPVFCPAITDGSIGDMLYFHSYSSPGLVLDLVQDVRRMDDEAVQADPRRTGVIILGGGLPKHHICNANMMRNGADYAVYINTANEFDGSDSGARPDEAVSWGKIRVEAKAVKVFCDATIAFPLLVAETFARHLQQEQAKHKGPTK